MSISSRMEYYALNLPTSVVITGIDSMRNGLAKSRREFKNY